MSPWLMIAIALAATCVGFAVVYALARAIDNYGVVDIAWSYAFGGVTLFYAWAGTGWLPRRVLLGVLVGVWSARLGTHLLRRVAAHHPEEDGRYRQLRHDWKANFAPRMFGFFQLQAASVILLALPFVAPMANAHPGFLPWEIAGIAVWVVALGGEAAADAQLAAFKRDATRRGQVCDTGLWRYSRHPNYFFEWLIWVAYLLFALGSPWGWIGAASPAIILYLLLRVTGIPLTEQQSLRSKGDAYRRYQERTSAFVPLPPKSP